MAPIYLEVKVDKHISLCGMLHSKFVEHPMLNMCQHNRREGGRGTFVMTYQEEDNYSLSS